MSAFGCDKLPYYVVIPFLSINALCVLVNVILIAFVFTRFCCGKCAGKNNDGFNKKIGVVSTIAMISLNVTSIILFCLVFIFVSCPSKRTNGSLYLTLAFIAPIFILSGYVSISASFFYRVVLAFKGSIVDIKNKNNKLHKIISILMAVESILIIIFGAAAIIGLYLQVSNKLQKNLFYICYVSEMIVVLTHVVLVMFLIKLFVKQLKHMFAFFSSTNNNVNGTCINHSSDNSNDGIARVSRKLINTATKAYASYVFTIISTVVCWVFAIIFIPLSGFKPNDADSNKVIHAISICLFYTLANIDSMINILCLSLQWPFSSNLYLFFCKRFHLIMMSKFSNEFKNASIDMEPDKNITQMEKNLASIH